MNVNQACFVMVRAAVRNTLRSMTVQDLKIRGNASQQWLKTTELMAISADQSNISSMAYSKIPSQMSRFTQTFTARTPSSAKQVTLALMTSKSVSILKN